MVDRQKGSFAKEGTNPDENKKKKFLKKHPPKTDASIADLIAEKAEAQSQYTQDVNALEANIKSFNERLEVLLDPVTKKPLMWIRHPTNKEWEKIIPTELWKYRDDPTKVPPDVAKKYEDQQFEIMAELIVKPKHDADWWKSNSPIPLQLLFQEHLIKQYKELGIDIGNF